MSQALVYPILAAAAGVTALIGSRIYPNEAPESLTVAQRNDGYAVYDLVAGVPDNGLDGELNRSLRVQLTAWCATAARATSIMNAISAALSPHGYEVLRLTTRDPETKRFGEIADFEFLVFT